MSFDLTNDAERVPGQSLPGISTIHLRRVRKWSLALVILLFLFLVLWWARTVYTDLLWFDQFGFRSIYSKILLIKLWLFVGGTLVSATALSLTLYLTFRFSLGPST